MDAPLILYGTEKASVHPSGSKSGAKINHQIKHKKRLEISDSNQYFKSIEGSFYFKASNFAHHSSAFQFKVSVNLKVPGCLRVSPDR